MLVSYYNIINMSSCFREFVMIKSMIRFILIFVSFNFLLPWSSYAIPVIGVNPTFKNSLQDVPSKDVPSRGVPLDVSQKIIKNLRQQLPDLKVSAILPSTIAGVYEVDSGHKVFYVDSSGSYLIIGNIVDLSTKTVLTQLRVESLSVVNWSDLPMRDALWHINDQGERRIAIFTDPTCPFCKQLEIQTIPRLKNVIIYYFLYPLPSHDDSRLDIKKILCSANPIDTYLSWMKYDVPLPQRSSCTNLNRLKIYEELAGDHGLGIDKTPTIVLPDGSLVTGFVPADYLNQLIDETASKVVVAPITRSNPVKVTVKTKTY